MILLLTFILNATFAQRGFNYYRDSSRVGSSNPKAFTYFKKAYYDHIWTWSRAGADSAEYYLKLAIREDSSYSAAYAFLGHVYQFKTYDNVDWDHKLAMQKHYAEKALSFHPKTGDAYSLMSDVKWHEKDTLQALNLLRQAIAQEPDHVGNYIFLAIRFTQMRQAADSAIYYLHRLLTLDPQYGQAYIKLANVYRDLNQIDSAKYYYQKAITHYQTIQPRDIRMLGAYYWLGQVLLKQKQYDSARYYYQAFLKEMEPTDYYMKDQALSSAHKDLYACHQALAGRHLTDFVSLNLRRLKEHPTDGPFQLGILDDFMAIEQDSVAEKYALPLARRLKASQLTRPDLQLFATFYEYDLLKRLKRPGEAIAILQAYNAKTPDDPMILFELGRMSVLSGKSQQGLIYLQKAKQHLNGIVTKEGFIAELQGPDFDKVRESQAYKALLH
ncbi:tetratricopeptide repeat protein [Larkinella soli]|uniref:tetratricopeptide repeat protein n=1 Tax=Larkinella soli TaxID=1770527 RepID=UPI000FFBABE0|nr:tetratricopeptide repeat protein [Larkinella soli]